MKEILFLAQLTIYKTTPAARTGHIWLWTNWDPHSFELCWLIYQRLILLKKSNLSYSFAMQFEIFRFEGCLQ